MHSTTLGEMETLADLAEYNRQGQLDFESDAMKQMRAATGQTLHAHEFVAIGLRALGESEQDVVWYALENEAEVGSRAYAVSDAEVRSALEDFRVRFPDRAYVVGGGYLLAPRKLDVFLWHSHYDKVEPSNVDIEAFPVWCNVGRVYHAPTQTTTRYDGTGIIKPVGGQTPPANDTGEVDG